VLLHLTLIFHIRGLVADINETALQKNEVANSWEYFDNVSLQ
jgi:hypothetical protein